MSPDSPDVLLNYFYTIKEEEDRMKDSERQPS